MARFTEFTCAAFALALTCSAGHVWAEEIREIDEGDARNIADDVDRDIAAMRGDLDVVERGYGQPLDTQVSRVDRRLREGEIHFLLKDYLRASIVLLDVVDDTRNKAHPKYDECVFLLAEALRKSKNYGGARRYYESTLDRVSGDRLKDVVLGLLEIAGATDRYDDVDRYIGRLRQAGSLSRPDVDYIYGKMLYRSSGSDATKVQRAYEVFQKVPSSSTIGAQASYYAGVALVTLGRYEDAIKQFLATVPLTKRDEQLKELTYISLGRLYQEIGDVSKSADSYQHISQRSPYFSDMLFEVAWAHVAAANTTKTDEDRRKSYSLALNATELLMATAPNSRLYPQAAILQGNLQIRLDAQEAAYDSFQSIIDRYGAARDKVAMIRRDTDPRKFFDDLLASDLEKNSASRILPPLAITWALEEDEMGRAVAVQQDLRDSDNFLRESRELVETLNQALAGEQRYNMFPGLAGARAKAHAIENRALKVRGTLLDTERRLLWKYLSQDRRSAVQTSRAQAEELAKNIETLPTTSEQVETGKAEIRESYLLAGRDAYKLTYRLASMRAQLVAVEVWIADNRKNLSDSEMQLMNERIRSASDEIGRIEASLDGLRGEIRRAGVGAGSDAGRQRAAKLRRQFDAIQGQEVALLRSGRSGAPGAYQAVFARIDQQRAAVTSVTSGLERLQTSLDAQVQDKVLVIQRDIAGEVSRLSGYRNEHASLKGESDQMLGPIASRTLESVRSQFDDVVLKADVGIIDVAWARKQQETEKVNELIKDQQEQTEELEREFADVLKED